MTKLYRYWIISANKKKSVEQKEQDVLSGNSKKNRAIVHLPSKPIAPHKEVSFRKYYNADGDFFQEQILKGDF
jgi:hypothetical protein